MGVGARLLKREERRDDGVYTIEKLREGRIDNFFPNKAKQAESVAQRALNNKYYYQIVLSPVLIFACFQGEKTK